MFGLFKKNEARYSYFQWGVGTGKGKNPHVIVAEENGEIVSSCVYDIITTMAHNQQPYAFSKM